MNKDNFYINDLSEIRAFCINSDKEDVYKYIYSLQQENQASKQTINELTKQIAKLVEDKKYLENQINGYRNTNINLIDKNKYLEQENKKLKGKQLNQRIDKSITSIDILIEIIKQQPTDDALDDLWILDKLNGFKEILKGDSNE